MPHRQERPDPICEPGSMPDDHTLSSAATMPSPLTAGRPAAPRAPARGRPKAPPPPPPFAPGRAPPPAGGRPPLPLAVTGAASPIPIVYQLPVPSAQVKSAVLLAGLNTPGATSVIEPQPTRDHTERMLRHFGAAVSTEPEEGGGLRVTIEGFPEMTAAPIIVPGDPSSAAFPLVAGLIVPDSDVTVEGVGINP